MPSDSNTPSVLERRIAWALTRARETARWDSGKPSTREDAMRFHAGLIFVIAALEGYVDEFLGIKADE